MALKGIQFSNVANPCFLFLLLVSITRVSSGSSDVQVDKSINSQGHEIEYLLPTEDSSNAVDETFSKNSKLDLKKLTKRAAYDDDSDQGYDWDLDTDSLDPGYESYLQSLQYDPMMAWGRRKRTRGDQYYLLPKRNFESADYPFDPYMHHLTERRNQPQDGYMEAVYLPHHFFPSFKRSLGSQKHVYNKLTKRSPSEMGAKGFHEGIFTHNFGEFSPVRRKKREIEKSDVEGNKISEAEEKSDELMTPRLIYNNRYPGLARYLNKRRFGMDASGFHGDTFSDGWGTFSTMRKRDYDYQGDPYADGYGYFYPMFKRRPEMDSMGFHGDTFNGGFGDFYTMKRRPEMDSSGFFGDTFSSGFGDFYTMKKKRSDNTNAQQRTKREAIMPKRRPEMTSSGFFGDTFSNGFGDFYTMKRAENKRRPEMTSSGFYGDTFSNGFGDFYTMKKKLHELRPLYANPPQHPELGTQVRNSVGELGTPTRNSGFGFGTLHNMDADPQKEPKKR